MSDPRDLLRCYRAPPPMAVPMLTEVRSDGGMKLHMLRAPSWNTNPGANSILRWSGSLSPKFISALWQELVEPDSGSGKSPERLINEWIANLSMPGYYLGTFVTQPRTSNGTYGSRVEVQVLFATQGDPARLSDELRQAGASAPAALQSLMTYYSLTPDPSPWTVQNLTFGGPGVAILPWGGVVNDPQSLAVLRNYLNTPTPGGPLPEQLINDALAKLLVGHYLGTFVVSATPPAKVQVLVGLNSTLRSDEDLGNPNNLTDDQYILRTILQTMSDSAQTFPDALAALQGLLQLIGSKIDTPDPPWFMLSQLDAQVIDPNAS